MNKDERRRLAAYYTEIASLLPCGRREKNRLLRELKADVNDYLAASPDAAPETVSAVFGTPEQIAESALQSVAPVALRRRLTLKRAALLALAVIVLAYLLFVVVSLIDVHMEAHGYFTEGILRIVTEIGVSMT